ncbi:AAA family ATPase [Pseudomonas sp. Sample_23]|uniref:AAA family ATPase n=1 Tax=Pseudomonas sp. Sample_23 TaxID=2448267 RepID=UPI001032863A|nr:AAA family ATPase [Pseudomonas sp. Sample_23]
MPRSFANLKDLASHLRQELTSKKFVILYAYNGTGKTRLSTTFKDLGKVDDQPDTLYFNAFTEDLFYWDNDLEEDRERKLKINRNSRFITALWELEMETRIRPFLDRYADFDFRIDTDNWEVIFSRKVTNPNFDENVANPLEERTQMETHIKVSRGEENIFIWCFFLAVVQLVLDGADTYIWVKYIYIDDPISSLDEHNAITVANHLAQLLTRTDKGPRTVVSSHHVLFFNVLSNELKNKAHRHFLKKGATSDKYILEDTTSKPFLHHLATLVELNELLSSGALYTHHFNMLRRVMEQTANFFGLNSWSDCIRVEEDDPDRTLHKRIIDLMSHGDYSLYEPREMMDENKDHFRRIFRTFIATHPFNEMLFSSEAN